MRDRGALDEHGIGGIGAGAPGARHDVGEHVEGIGFLSHSEDSKPGQGTLDMGRR